MEGRDRPIDRLAKNVLLFGQQDEGEVDVSGGAVEFYYCCMVDLSCSVYDQVTMSADGRYKSVCNFVLWN